MNKGTLSETEILSKLLSRDEPAEYSIDKTSDSLQDSLKRLGVWNKIGNEHFATLELRYIQNLAKEDTFKEPEFAKSVTPLAHKEFLIMNIIRIFIKSF